MGNLQGMLSYQRTPQKAKLEDYIPYSMGYSKSAGTSDWDYTGDKNFDYWFSKDRFTYISLPSKQI